MHVLHSITCLLLHYKLILFVVLCLWTAPQPMVKPDFYGVKGPNEIAMILPQASEEFGPIAYYYLVVVPEEPTDPPLKFTFKQPDQYMTDDVSCKFSCVMI